MSDNLETETSLSAPGLGARLAGATAVMAGLALAGKGLGLVREMVIAHTFGAGRDYDAFLVAFTGPEILSFVALYVAFNLFLPQYLRERERSPQEAEALASAYLGYAAIVLLAVGGGLVAAARPLVVWLAPELDPAARELAVVCLRILAGLVVFRGLEGTLRGLLNAHRRFFWPAMGAMLSSLVVIVAVLRFGPGDGVVALAWGVLAGALLPVLVLLPLALRDEPGLVRHFGRTSPMLRQLLRLLPVFLVIELISLSLPLVDRALAARYLEPGRISALAYARILYEVPFNLVGMTLATALFPEFAQLAARRDTAGFADLVRRGVRVTLATMLPAAVLFVVLRFEIAQAVFQRGAFDAEATQLTGGALAGFAVGLPFLAAFVVLNQGAIAAHRLGRLFGAKAAAMVVKIAVSWWLVGSLGHVGIALGTAAFFLTLFLLLLPLVTGSLRGVWAGTPVLLGAAAASGALGWVLARAAGGVGWAEGWVGIGVQALIWSAALALYVGLCRWGRVEEMLWVERTIRRRLGGKG